MENKPKVKLTNVDGNIFDILGIVRKALKENGQADKIKEFLDETTSGDYSNLLATCSKLLI